MPRREMEMIGLAVIGLVCAALWQGCGSGLACPPGTSEDTCGIVSIPEYPSKDSCRTCQLPDGTFHGPYEILRPDGSVKVEGFHYYGESCGVWRTYGFEGDLIERREMDPCGPFAYLGHI